MDKPIPEAVRLRELAHEVATHGPKNWRKGLLAELQAALTAAQQPDHIVDATKMVAQQQGQVAVVCLVTEKRYPHFAEVQVQLYDDYKPKNGDKLYLAPQPMQQGQAVASVPAHYAENILAAACLLEQRGDLDDTREAKVLRKIAGMMLAAPQPMQQGGGEELPVCVCCEDCGTEIEAYCPKCNTAPPSAPVGVECNCPGEGKTDPSLHAPNRPVRLAQQPAAVDEAMVERAANAYCDWFNGREGINTNALRAALTAALATQHQEPTT